MLDLIKTIAKFLPTYLTSVISLFAGPKTYIAEHNSSNEDLQDALLFAAVSACIALFLTPQMALPSGDITKGLGTRFAFILAANCFVAAAIAGSYRLVGGKAPFNRFLATYLYVSGMSSILLSVPQSVIFGIATAFDREAVKQFFELSRDANSLSPLDPTLSPQMQSVKLVSSAAVRVLLVGLFITGGLALAWFIACWGAFRQITNVSRLRSAVAFVLGCIACTILGLALTFAVRGLGL